MIPENVSADLIRMKRETRSVRGSCRRPGSCERGGIKREQGR